MGLVRPEACRMLFVEDTAFAVALATSALSGQQKCYDKLLLPAASAPEQHCNDRGWLAVNTCMTRLSGPGMVRHWLVEQARL